MFTVNNAADSGNLPGDIQEIISTNNFRIKVQIPNSYLQDALVFY